MGNVWASADSPTSIFMCHCMFRQRLLLPQHKLQLLTACCSKRSKLLGARRKRSLHAMHVGSSSWRPQMGTPCMHPPGPTMKPFSAPRNHANNSCLLLIQGLKQATPWEDLESISPQPCPYIAQWLHKVSN